MSDADAREVPLRIVANGAPGALERVQGRDAIDGYRDDRADSHGRSRKAPQLEGVAESPYKVEHDGQNETQSQNLDRSQPRHGLLKTSQTHKSTHNLQARSGAKHDPDGRQACLEVSRR